jgi:carboxyl-terminal processing protease
MGVVMSNQKNSREKARSWVLVLSACVTAFSIGVFAERQHWLGSSKTIVSPAKDAKDGYQFFDTLVDLRTQIRKSYVEQPVDDEKLLTGAINGMLSELDPYSNYFTKEEFERFDRSVHGTFSGIGAEMAQDAVTKQFMIVSPLEDSPALKAGVLAGDRLLKINGESLEGLSLPDLTMRIQGPKDTEVTVTVIHEGEKTPVDIKIRRGVVQVHSVKGYKRDAAGTGWDYLASPEHRVAYVRITNFMESTAEEMDKALLPLFKSKEGLRGIILDLRFNPGGLLLAGVDVSDRFLESGTIVTTRKPGGPAIYRADAKSEGTYPNVPVVVLVNEYSASASEIVAGALKDNGRALLIGARSFGKGSVQDLISLDNGNAAMKLTTHYYYLPSGRNIAKRKDSQTWGVEPDPIFNIPLSDAENRAILMARARSEVIRVKLPTTAPAAPAANGIATTKPAEEEVDRQLTRALETLVAMQIFKNEKPVTVPAVSTTRPEVEVGTPPAPTTTKPAEPPATKETPKTKPATVPASKPATKPATKPVEPPTTTKEAPKSKPADDGVPE